MRHSRSEPLSSALPGADRLPAPHRSLPAAPSRRAALRLLAGLALGPLGPWRVADAHDALPGCRKKKGKKRKKCLKRARAHNARHATPQVFEFTGGPQSYTAPARGIVTVEAIGAEGGRGGDGAFGGELGTLTPGAGGAGGLGSKVIAAFPVAAGEELRIEVGGVGADGTLGGAGGGGGVAGGKGGKGGDGGSPDFATCAGSAEGGDPGVASPENLNNQGAGGDGGCAFGPPGAVVGLGPGGPGRVTVTFSFA